MGKLASPLAHKTKDYAFALALAAGLTVALGPSAYGQAPSRAREAQSSSSRPARAEPADPTATGPSLAVGRVIYAELARTIEASKAKVGKPIEAKVTLAVLSHGKVLIANGAEISGHVTEVKRRSDKNPESVLGIVFNRAKLKNGGELPLALTVQAVGIGGFASGRMAGGLGAQTDGEYSATAALPAPPAVRGYGTPSGVSGASPDLPEAAREPALDVGSKGVVGLSDLKLEEGDGPQQGSLIISTTKDVKLDSGDELVLRVIAAHPQAAATPGQSAPI
jgi:biotin carboxyl carrier protein